MSTRSGRRIHNSFHDDAVTFEPDLITKSERKTRSKRLKEINDQLDVTMPKLAKRENYVSYPTDDEHVGDAGLSHAKNTKKTRRNTLKEQNVNIQNAEFEDIVVDTKKPNRVTRQTRKLAENNPEDVSVGDQDITGALDKKKNKKSKKKKRSCTENLNENDTEPVVTEKLAKKSKKTKKHSNSSAKLTKTDVNKSNISTDSFHSAAGSPLKEDIKVPVISIGKSSENQKVNTTFEIEEVSVDTPMNTTFEKETKSKKKLSVKNSSFDKTDITTASETPRKLSIKNLTFHKNHNPSETRKSSLKNSTSDKIDCPVTPVKARICKSDKVDSMDIENPNKFYTTFETEPKTRRSLHNSNTIDGIAKEVIVTKNNMKNSTGDKEIKLNSTYDKIEVTSSKSSLISSDSMVNVTFDKSDNSRVSITSDDSKTENIINTTPVLIESSIDESKHSELLNMSNKTKTPDKNVPVGLQSVTPLKREGTFTKEGPEITTSLKPKISSERTPTKRMSLPSPGFTPYRVSQTSQSSQKEKRSLLNVTRSIEKQTRRSSLAEQMPRQTRVMFCSPVNNPGMMTQQKKKIIKSSLKGSNKSFLFEESEPPVRPATRKRSLTQDDAQHSRAKRKRLADGLQHSVDRLSRPRTSSASAKLAESTPARKPVTPSKTRSDVKRTKLPNFAELHRKQFDRMESLDECQLRKARRARQLLTPTVLERSSPGGTSMELKITSTELKGTSTEPKGTTAVSKGTSTEPKGTSTEPKGTSTEPKGTSTKTKELSKEKETKQTTNPEPTLPPLDSLRPGFTRFGFRINCDANPFSITKTKTAKENNGLSTQMEKTKSLTSKKEKPNTLTNKEKLNGLTRQLTQPSLNGGTISRKAVAKQTVMREKSFSSLFNRRDSKRNENRTVIKGVRTNRRFELQMQMRNLD